MAQNKIPPSLLPRLQRQPNDRRPVVLMTCGLAGAGKSTLSKSLIAQDTSFKRLSIDAYIHKHHGEYNTDYEPALYDSYLDEAGAALKDELRSILREKDISEYGIWNVVLDFAFPFRDTRDEWRDIIDEEGGRAVLVYLRCGEDLAWRRISGRWEGKKDGERGADGCFEITRETLKMYVGGFEIPGEDENVLVIDVIDNE